MVKVQLTPEQIEEKKKKQEDEKKQKQEKKERIAKEKEENEKNNNSKSNSHLEDNTSLKTVVYEGKTVIEVLQQGHTDTHFHCKMSDSSTMHVPRLEFK